MHVLMKALCPKCDTPLLKVKQKSGSPLNADQFDSIKAGDWYCTECPGNGRGVQEDVAYFWEREVKQALPEGLIVGVLSADRDLRIASVTAEDTPELDTEILLFTDGVTAKVRHIDMVIPETELTRNGETILRAMFEQLSKRTRTNERREPRPESEPKPYDQT